MRPIRWPFRSSRAGREQRERRRLGLALGGGAVRGAAHLGVLEVLEREGVRPDVVAGTSVGAVVGAGVAAGVTAADMYEHFLSMRWKDIARPSWGSRLSMFAGDPMASLMEHICGVKTFAELDLPFAAVACDLLTGERYVFTEGPLREALMASSAIPGLFEPVRRGGRLLVDGGVVDNVPIAEALSLGADIVVAVDVMPPLHGEYEPRDVKDMILMSASVLAHAAGDRSQADLLIAPEVAGMSFSDFTEVPALHDAGVRAAEAALPKLREILQAAGRT